MAARRFLETNRCVVWLPPRDLDPRRLPPALPAGEHEPLGGGERSMHELAVALAAAGHRVEMRGRVETAELARLGAAAGALPDLPADAREIVAGDTILIAEGYVDLLVWARLALAPARVIVVALGPLGLNGWPFTEGWKLPVPETVALASLARPEHLRSLRALGFELWTHMPLLAERARAAGVPCSFIGNGRPLPYPQAGERRFDVATITRNRWSATARTVVQRLDRGVRHLAIEGTNEDVLRLLGETRILVHPVRIEGHSRLGCEARAMGAVPVVLDSNPYAVGLDAAHGAVSLGSPEEMPAAIGALLADPSRLRALSERGMRTAREQVAWPEYVTRVDAALRAEHDDVARPARAALGRALHDRAAELEARVEALERRLPGRVNGSLPAGDAPGLPAGAIDLAVLDAGIVRVEGWTLFGSGPTVSVEVSLGGVSLGEAVTGFGRADVREATAVLWGATSGFQLLAPWPPAVAEAAEVRVTATAVDGERFVCAPVALGPAGPE